MNQICEYDICTACQACKTACPAHAINMKEDDHGFVYPIIDESVCIDCGKCQKVCPALNKREDFNLPIKTYAGWIKDEHNRHYSTSGGASYALSKKIVEEGGVFCGCRWNKDHAEHAFAETIDDLRQFQGSKYAYSNIGDCDIRIKDYLEQGRKVLFVGTSCQVAGLKSYLQKSYENLITVDLLCHGIPSQRALRDRVAFVEKENDGKHVVEVRFRDKREDQHHTYVKYTFEDGSNVYHAVYQDFFFRGFDGNFLLRPNCFKCQYAQGERISDITLADFWGYNPQSIRFHSFRNGVSLLLANTEKGRAIINSLPNFQKEERDYAYARRGNRNLNRPQQKPRFYEEFWDAYLRGGRLEELSKEFFPAIPIPPVRKNDWRTWKNLIMGPSFNEKTMGLIRKYLSWAYLPVKESMLRRKISAYRKTQINRLESLSNKDAHVFYLGITEQPNLGDMAQHYCIKNWIGENYPNHQLVMFESKVITDPKFTTVFFQKLKKVFKKDDVIVIQSGYCTQDLGGDHPLMHRLVCDYMPEAKILMMPQTIYFQHEENKRICAENHNKAKNMLFLARDFVSYDMAKEMFPDIRVKAFPDIVTTLIGTLNFNHKRKGVCLCTRNDGEKLYSKEQINLLEQRFESEGISVVQKDTQGKASVQSIRKNLQQFIEKEIESYSTFDVTITDRYHGTIFSLCAGTPVIIIKTTDHKVTTGADWFKGIYDDYVYVAEDLDDAYRIARNVLSKNLSHKLAPYFKSEYYDKLKACFENRM